MKFFKPYENLNLRITEDLIKRKIDTRSNASHGLRLCLYLPLCSTQACRLLLYPAILFIKTLSSKSNLTVGNSFVNSVISTLLTYFTLGFNNDYGLLKGCIVTVLFSYLYPYCVLSALKLFPKSFTVGEASLVTQGMMVFVFNALENLYIGLYQRPNSEYEIIKIINQVGVLSLMLTLLSLYLMPPSRYGYKSFAAVGAIVISVVLYLDHILNEFTLLWIVKFLSSNNTRIWLLSFWSLLSVLSTAAVLGQVFTALRASTARRKIFHILGSLVYISGYIYDLHLIYLASSVALAGLIVLETVRKLKLGSLSVLLEEGFTCFADEKDAEVSLTPLYLLIGLALPLTLTSNNNRSVLILISGVLAIGIGDTFASIFGSKYGKHRWHGSSKSVEGTVASITSQLLIVTFLMHFGYITANLHTVFISAIAIIINAIEEAFTDQVDNLSLPLTTYFILKLA